MMLEFFGMNDRIDQVTHAGDKNEQDDHIHVTLL